jgi:hypothetical protein
MTRSAAPSGAVATSSAYSGAESDVSTAEGAGGPPASDAAVMGAVPSVMARWDMTGAVRAVVAGARRVGAHPQAPTQIQSAAPAVRWLKHWRAVSMGQAYVAIRGTGSMFRWLGWLTRGRKPRPNNPGLAPDPRKKPSFVLVDPARGARNNGRYGKESGMVACVRACGEAQGSPDTDDAG